MTKILTFVAQYFEVTNGALIYCYPDEDFLEE